MVKELDCNIVVTTFEFLLHNYIHFQTNDLGKGMNPFISLVMGWVFAYGPED